MSKKSEIKRLEKKIEEEEEKKERLNHILSTMNNSSLAQQKRIKELLYDIELNIASYKKSIQNI